MIYRDGSNTVNFKSASAKRRVIEGGGVLSRGGEMGSETTTTRSYLVLKISKTSSDAVVADRRRLIGMS